MKMSKMQNIQMQVLASNQLEPEMIHQSVVLGNNWSYHFFVCDWKLASYIKISHYDFPEWLSLHF